MPPYRITLEALPEVSAPIASIVPPALLRFPTVEPLLPCSMYRVPPLVASRVPVFVNVEPPTGSM